MKATLRKYKKYEADRKKRDEEETARELKLFEELFKVGDTPGSNAFICGGVMDANQRLKKSSEGENSKDELSDSKKGSRYILSFTQPAYDGRSPEKKEEKQRKDFRMPRVIDEVLEEIKLGRGLRAKHAVDLDQDPKGCSPLTYSELPDYIVPVGKCPGSFDDGDPESTNVYVGNLAPQVDENFLLRTFGRFGPIASVKIMWPRTEEERRKQKNCGFVAFMKRTDAEAAKDEMQGVVVHGYELKIGWGKSISLPAQALPVPLPGHMETRNKEGASMIIPGLNDQLATSVRSQGSELVLAPDVPDVVVVPPEDKHLRHVIDTMALHVLDCGCAFEEAIARRVRGRQQFSFLFELTSKDRIYYIWRLYSYAQGDTLHWWRTEPFIMIAGSGRWIPPPLPSNSSLQRKKESYTTYSAGRSRHIDLERTLTDAQQDEFEDILQALTLERIQIKEGMGFALDNADAAKEVVKVITKSLTLEKTPIPNKVARLMLVSDILHNSSAPVKNASAFRTEFQATLPDIMESFNDLYCCIPGRITAEALKERVLKVLQVWEDWFIFSSAYLNGLRKTFLRSGNSGVIPYHSLRENAPESEDKFDSEDQSEADKLNQDAPLAMGKEAGVKELLGLPLAELARRCRDNGLSLCGGREMMVARLLDLEEGERGRVCDQEKKIRYEHDHAVTYVKFDGSWNAFSIAPGGANVGEKAVDPFGWNWHSEEAGGGSPAVPTSSILVVPQPEQRTHTNKKRKSDIVLPVSKWNHYDDGYEDNKRDDQDFGLRYLSKSTVDGLRKEEDTTVTSEAAFHAHHGARMNKEYRQRLRRLEVAVMEYRECLEEKDIQDIEEIEKLVAIHRSQLQFEYALSCAGDNIKSDKHSSRRTSMERIDKCKDARSCSRKRHCSQSRSLSPPKSYLLEIRIGKRDCDNDKLLGRDKPHDAVSELGREHRMREKKESRRKGK